MKLLVIILLLNPYNLGTHNKINLIFLAIFQKIISVLFLAIFNVLYIGIIWQIQDRYTYKTYTQSFPPDAANVSWQFCSNRRK